MKNKPTLFIPFTIFFALSVICGVVAVMSKSTSSSGSCGPEVYACLGFAFGAIMWAALAAFFGFFSFIMLISSLAINKNKTTFDIWVYFVSFALLLLDSIMIVSVFQ